MKVVPVIICVVLTILILLAVLAGIKSILRLRRQLKKEFKEIDKLPLGNKDSPVKIARELQNSGALKKLPEKNYLARRVRDSVDIVLNNEKCFVNNQLPSVDDWHECDEMDERTRMDVCLFYTMTSSMLIMGIVGTLLSLHGVLLGVDPLELLEGGSNGKIFSKIAIALSPSLFATGGTFILMVLRGVYEMLFERLEERMDRYTLNVLVPCFQMQTLEEQREKEMEDSKELLKDSMDLIIRKYNEDYEPYFRAVEGYKDCLSRVIDRFCDASSRIVRLITEMEHSMSDGAKHMQQVERLKVWGAMEEIDKTLKRIADDGCKFGDKLVKHNENLGRMASEQKKLMGLFTRANDVKVLESAREQWEKTCSGLQQLIQDGESLLSTVTGSNDKLGDFNTLVQTFACELGNSLKLLNERKQVIENITQKTHDHLLERGQEMEALLGCFEKTKDCVQRWNQNLENVRGELRARRRTYFFIKQKI